MSGFGQFEKFMNACKNDDLETLIKLLTKNKFGNDEILYDFAEFVGPRICAYLLEHIDNINSPIEFTYCNLLHKACYHSNYEMVMLILNQSDMEIDVLNNNGWSAVHVACCYNDNVDIVKLLIDKGANFNRKTLLNETPLSLACAREAHAIVNELLNQPSIIVDETNIDIKEYKVKYPHLFPTIECNLSEDLIDLNFSD